MEKAKRGKFSLLLRLCHPSAQSKLNQGLLGLKSWVEKQRAS